jgi:hypothetical protein
MVNSATVAFAISCNSDPFLVGQKDPMICLSLAKSLVGTGINLELFLVEEGSDDTYVV